MIVVWVRWFSLETRAFLLYYNYYYYCQPCRLSCPTWWCVKSILEGNVLKDGICDNIFMNGNHWSARRWRRSFRPVGGYVGMNGRGRERKWGSEARYRWNVYGQSMRLLLNFGRIHRQSHVFLFHPAVAFAHSVYFFTLHIYILYSAKRKKTHSVYYISIVCVQIYKQGRNGWK